MGGSLFLVAARDNGARLTTIERSQLGRMAANEGWADSGDALTLIHPFPGAAPGTRAMHARLDWTRPRVGSTIHPTSSVTVSLPVKGFARSIAGSERSALRKKESSRNLHSKSLISPAPAYSRARPSAPSSEGGRAALTSPKDQLNGERRGGGGRGGGGDCFESVVAGS